MMWKNAVEPKKSQMTKQGMRLSPPVPKSTNTLRIRNVYCYQLQQWLNENASMPRYTYIAYLVITGTQCVHCEVRNTSLNIIRHI